MQPLKMGVSALTVICFLSACSGQPGTPSPNHPTSGAQATKADLYPSGQATSNVTKEAALGYEFRTGQTPHDVALTAVGIVDYWEMDGTIPGLGNRPEVYSSDPNTFSAQEAKKNVPIDAPKLFGPNYKGKAAANPNIDRTINLITEANAGNLTAFIRTDQTGMNARDTNPNNHEAWYRKVVLKNVISTTRNAVGDETVVALIEEDDNRDQNIYAGDPTLNRNNYLEKMALTYRDDGKTIDVVDMIITNPDGTFGSK